MKSQEMETSIDIFKLCPIGQYPKQGWSGSTVPVLENRIKEYEEMISKLEGVDYIEHRIYCKKGGNKINNIQRVCLWLLITKIDFVYWINIIRHIIRLKIIQKTKKKLG